MRPRPLDDDQVPREQRRGGIDEAAAVAAGLTINTLNKLYAAATPLYPQASASQLVDTPQPVRQTSVDMLQAKATSAEQAPLAIEQITAVLRERHHLAEDDDDDFKILNVTEIAHAAARSAELMGALLMIVAAISLVVGGVGIMNIMLVSVTERTREIGLRMAVGARRHHILQQFLVEAVLLCLAGGVLGILAGRGTSMLVREFQHWTIGVSVPAIVVSVLVAAAVGIVFGFYPAWKASRLGSHRGSGTNDRAVCSGRRWRKASGGAYPTPEQAATAGLAKKAN